MHAQRRQEFLRVGEAGEMPAAVSHFVRQITR